MANKWMRKKILSCCNSALTRVQNFFIDDKQYVLSTYVLCTYVQAGYTKRFLVARILEHDSSYRVIAFKVTVKPLGQ